MQVMVGAMKAKLDPRKAGAWPRHTEDVDECPDAVHHQDEGRVNNRRSRRLIEENGNEDRCPEHRKQMLQAQWNALQKRHLLVDLDGFSHPSEARLGVHRRWL
jgi:hypothetical protein